MSTVIATKEQRLTQITSTIASCRDCINDAIDAGATSDEIMRTVADAIGLDLDSVPSFMMGPIRNAMAMAVKK